MLEEIQGKRNPYSLLMGLKTAAATLVSVWRTLKPLKMNLPCDSDMPFLSVGPKDSTSSSTGFLLGGI